jgi:hypothetical protein
MMCTAFPVVEIRSILKLCFYFTGLTKHYTVDHPDFANCQSKLEIISFTEVMISSLFYL